MTTLQNWAAAMCSAGIGCALLHMLCPAGKMRRVFSVLTAVFFLCCLLVPLKTIVSMATEWFALPEETIVSEELTEEVNAQTEAVLADVLLADAMERLGDTATVKKVAVVRDNTRADGIYIERVRITLGKEDRPAAQAVRATLEKAWGTVVEVYYVG